MLSERALAGNNELFSSGHKWDSIMWHRKQGLVVDRFILASRLLPKVMFYD